MTRPLAMILMMRCWIPENSFAGFLNVRSVALPVEKVRHDETVGNDVDDEVLNATEQLHKLFKCKINGATCREGGA
jgi:hypothetical protein